LRSFSIDRAKLLGYFIFFDAIAYHSGTRAASVFSTGEKYLLNVEEEFTANNLIIPIKSSTKREYQVHEVIFEKLGYGFTSMPDALWLVDPKFYAVDQGYNNNLALSLRMNFLHGLHCPPAETPVEDILRFREKKSAELEAFFVAMKEASDQLDVKGDYPYTLHVPHERITAALDDLNTVANETWFEGVRKSFRFDYRLSKSTIASIPAAFLLSNQPLAAAVALAAGIYRDIDFSLSLLPQREQADTHSQAFAFAFEAQQEFPSSDYTHFGSRDL
jgi:hypothetical protein